jgi:hypothetical protein
MTAWKLRKTLHGEELILDLMPEMGTYVKLYRMDGHVEMDFRVVQGCATVLGVGSMERMRSRATKLLKEQLELALRAVNEEIAAEVLEA